MVDKKLYRSMIGTNSMWPHQGWMSCLVCAYVQDFKPDQEKVIWRLQREYWSIWSIHKMLVHGISQSLS
jgi:hypothetical protein